MPLAPPVTIATRPESRPMRFSLLHHAVAKSARAVYWVAGHHERFRMNDELLDRLTIRQLVEDWAVLRDARMWERFRPVWHDDGVMMATWFQGTRDEFIKVSEEGYQKGVRILHFLGGSTIDVCGTRAIAQTKM